MTWVIFDFWKPAFFSGIIYNIAILKWFSQTYEYQLKTFWWLVFGDFFLVLLAHAFAYFELFRCFRTSSSLDSKLLPTSKTPTYRSWDLMFWNFKPYYYKHTRPFVPLFLGYLPLFPINPPTPFIPNFEERTSISINHFLKQTFCKKSFAILWTIWYHLWNFRGRKHSWRSVIFL